ncbi:MAG: TonB-dependent receptor [Fidelibacterota bacterium]
MMLIFSVFSLQAANYGKITGTVFDSKKTTPLVGANILIENSSLGAASDKNGNYVILQVPPGRYNVRCEMMGYKPMKIENVEVFAGRIATVQFPLEATVLDMDEVVVVAQKRIIEQDIGATTHSVSSEDIETLPTTTISDVLVTQPGVVSRNGLHFRGGRSGEITYMVDGIAVIVPQFADISSSEIINLNAIAEMQVISGTYSAEYGNALSGIINITTREGSSHLNGNVDIKSSKVGVETDSKNYNRNIIRFGLNGPLFSKKTNFLFTTTFDDRDSYLLDAMGNPFGFRKDQNYFVKISDRHINNIKLGLSASISDHIHQNYYHSWRYIPDMMWWKPRRNSQISNLSMTHTLRSNLYYSVNVHFNQYHYDSGDYDYSDLSAAYARDENKEFYTLNYVNDYEEHEQKTLGIKSDVLWQANSSNEIKAGVYFKQHEIYRFYVNPPYYANHQMDYYTRNPYEAAAYIQDKLNFSSIIISAGLRFDLAAANTHYWENPFDAVNGNTMSYKKSKVHTQLSPRLAASYPVSDKTVFHFGYGHYFQRPDYEILYKSQSDDNPPLSYDAKSDGKIDYKDNILISLKDGNGRYGNGDLKPEKTITYEFGLNQQLFDNYLLKISVYSKKITNLLGTRTFFAGDNPDWWETFTLHINEDFAYNNGIEFQFRKIYGTHLTGEIAYTYAVAEGSSSGPLERVGVEEANRQTLKFFPLNFDQRHTVNATGIFRFFNFRTTLLFQYGSGLPYTKGIRGVTEPYEINNKRLPENWTLDLKMDYQLKLFNTMSITPYLEIKNLTDRRNVVRVDPYTGKPDEMIGRTKEYAANPLNWGMPRIIYLGLNFKF